MLKFDIFILIPLKKLELVGIGNHNTLNSIFIVAMLQQHTETLLAPDNLVQVK